MMLARNTTYIIFNFNKTIVISDWRVVNDVVMGGCSTSKFFVNEEGHGVFQGTISTENNGGFSFLRYRFEKLNITEFRKVLLHIKGDGKKYQFKMKSNKYDQHSYMAYFQTTNEWQLIEIPLAELTPTFRGRKLNIDNYNGEQVEEIGFLIANKKNKSFNLILNLITLK